MDPTTQLLMNLTVLWVVIYLPVTYLMYLDERRWKQVHCSPVEYRCTYPNSTCANGRGVCGTVGMVGQS